ncbi:MAG: tetratricopeptide repeat protein, partial [Candidatus Margulisbacteria bacterium]|nr:tetratricopeptide repeat protein [Candidatus Margulisiibacteriota bacterium]
AFSLDISGDKENISLKAGPTEPGEGLSLVWVEAIIYPKTVKDDKIISLGVRTASRVKEVQATFDFSANPINLSTNDSMSWSTTYSLPDTATVGVHVVRYKIIGQSGGAIQRTVEFFVEKQSWMPRDLSAVNRGERAKTTGWPLTVTSTCTAVSGQATRQLTTGSILIGISKVPWYKVIFDDGKEGWVSASYVKEPTEDYFYMGFRAYQAKKYTAAIKYYRDAVTINPQLIKGYIWLAKSYSANGDLSSAAEAIKQSLQLNPRDIDSRVVANSLAKKFLYQANLRYRAKRYHEAVASYREALALDPNSTKAWVDLGESLLKLGLNSEANDAWREGLRFDPQNSQLLAALKVKGVDPASLAENPIEVKEKKQAVPSMVADDSLRIVKDERTSKGTRVEAAIKSVISLTKSVGTPIVEKGWKIKRQGEKFLVSYLCEQNSGGLESFDWMVDVDTKRVAPHNDNARLLMSRW